MTFETFDQKFLCPSLYGEEKIGPKFAHHKAYYPASASSELFSPNDTSVTSHTVNEERGSQEKGKKCEGERRQSKMLGRRRLLDFPLRRVFPNDTSITSHTH